MLWDQITEQLRTQMHSLENGNGNGSDRSHGPATPAGRNGQ
jgi:hypothetical protein